MWTLPTRSAAVWPPARAPFLVVDATQGVEAQTLANTYMALEHDLELVPILNKIDLPSAHPDEVAQEVEDVIGLPCMDAPASPPRPA